MENMALHEFVFLVQQQLRLSSAMRKSYLLETLWITAWHVWREIYSVGFPIFKNFIQIHFKKTLIYNPGQNIWDKL